MAVEIKVAPDEKLELVKETILDRSPNSDYFNITELNETFSGGKNAFLIAGSDLLEPGSELRVQIRDAGGNTLYNEASNGAPLEYYEGISKIVAVYVYPTETAFGPATITIIGHLKDNPTQLVKWNRTINIDPSLPNTTRVRFYKRPIVSIVEQLSPIYAFDTTGSKVASLVTQSFANIKVSQLDTFAGDVKRVKVYRTSKGDISDYDLIQDILVESKELLTTTTLSGSVVGEAGLFTTETLKKLWNTGSLSTALTSSRIDNGLSLKGSGKLRYTGSLNLTNGNTYELGIDAFYSASTNSDMGIYISGSQNGAKLIGTLNGIVPTKNLKDQVFAFTLDKTESTASLYLSQSQSEWHVGNISLKASEDSAFSPSEISFVTSMPTVLGNETYNFKFEFYDVNNNYVPVAVTQSALFSGGNNNIGGTLVLISGSTSASNASILALSQSVSGTIGVVTGSVNTVSASVSSVSASLSSSISSSKGAAISSSFGNIQTLANGNFSGSFIGDTTIFAPVIGGNNGYISSLFKVGTAPSIYLDARQNPRKIFIGGVADVGSYNSGSTTVYMDSDGKFSLGDKLTWSGTALTLAGSINITGGQAATDIANAASSGSTALSYAVANNATASAAAAAQAASDANDKIFTSTTGLVNKAPTPGTTSGLYLGNNYMGYYNGADWKTYMSSTGDLYLNGTNGYLQWNSAADSLSIKGNITATTGYIGTAASGFAINSSYFRNGTKTSYNGAGTGVYVGTDGIGLGTAFTVSAAGALNAASVTITGGTITIGSNFSVSNTGIITAAGAILSGKVTAESGNIGGWVVDGVILRDANSRMKLNPTTPGLEIYDTSGNKKVDIKQGSLSDPASTGTYSVGANGVSITWGPAGNLPNSGNPYVSSGYNTLSISTAGSYKVAASPTWNTSNANFIAFSGGTIYGSTYASVYLAFCTTPTYASPVAVIQVGQSDVVNNGTYSTTKYFAMNVDNSQYTVSLPATTLYVFTVIQFVGNVGASGGVFGINATITPANKSIVLQLNQIEITDEGMLVVAGANNYAKISRTTSSDMVVVKQDSTSYAAISAANNQGSGYAAIKTTAGDISSAGRLITLGFDSNIASSGYNNYPVRMYQSGPRMGELYLSTSTRKHKKDIIDWEKDNILDKIKLVNPKKFRYKTWDDTTELTLGLIAEDLRDNELDEATLHTYDENNIKQSDVEGIDWEKISAILWKGVQELTERIESLEAKISGSI
jgi:hypothetical protein